MRHSLTAALLLTLACTFPPLALAERTRVELSDPSRPVDLRVEVEWGSIRILADGTATGLTIDALGNSPDEIVGSPITISESGNLVAVRQAPLRSGTFRSANLEIRMPPAASVSLQMNRGGDVWVRGVEGQVEVTNLNGSVELADLSGSAAVNASNGSIRAGFAAVDRQRDMIFTSLNGSVELCLPADFSSRLQLTTAGDPIRSDFEIEREESMRTVGPGESSSFEGSEIRGRIGSGEAVLQVSTLNGEIHLARCE